MNSSPHSSEPSRAGEREDLITRLHALLARRQVELQLYETRQAAARAAQAEWGRIRRKLEVRVVAPVELIDRLTTMVYVARTGHPLRLLLCGPPGAGKSYIAAALAAAISDHTVSIDATAITESGWSGVSLEDALTAAGGPERLTGGAIIVEELDKIRVHPHAHGNAVDKYRNQQSQWLSLLDRAGRTTLSRGTLVSGRVHVIMTGAFADAPWARAGAIGEVSREAVVAYGLLPELVDRIDHVIALTSPAAAELARILQHEVEAPVPTALEQAVIEFGYSLRIEPSVYPYIAQALRRGATAGTRMGRAIIEDAVQRTLASAIREKLPMGAVLRIAPDDVRLPSGRDDPPPGRGGNRGDGRRPVRRR
jgi:SpoVK/Ycf46/Vps4 family AAA+-type ATPase